MLRDAPFRICLILSACIHIAIFYPWSFFNLISNPEINFKPVELTYFKTREVENIPVQDNKTVASIPKNAEKKVAEPYKTAEPETAKIVLKKENESKIKVIEAKKTAPSKEIEFEIIEDKKGISVAKELGPQELILCEDYYSEVRRRIKTALEKKRSELTTEGELRVKFIVNRDGALKELSVYKSAGNDIQNLEKIAIDSIREAAPFPAFNNRIKQDELTFKLPIRFIYR